VVGEAVSMTETFITHIRIDKVRNVENLGIQLCDDGRKHLIITGQNGSGKTSLLLAINNALQLRIQDAGFRQYPSPRESTSDGIRIQLSDIEQNLNDNSPERNTFVNVLFEAKRQANFSIPQGVHKIDLNVASISPTLNSLSQHFIQHIVNLKAERSFARDDGDEESVRKLDDWFSHFEIRLQDLFEDEKLELIFDRKTYNFLIKLAGREPFGLSELSDGYSAVMRIITEIMLRMEGRQNSAYDLEGIVLIDEIETHLHVELQKKILPFLCDFFPRIQFIVSTHSPFVLSSVENAVICDLQNRIVTEDLSGYSYDTLIESYFKSDKYSDILKRKVARYEALADMPEKSDREMDEYFELKDELSSLPKYLAPELDVKLKQIELKHLS
jgi:predicted ATP-binding protein involved in virulence